MVRLIFDDELEVCAGRATRRAGLSTIRTTTGRAGSMMERCKAGPGLGIQTQQNLQMFFIAFMKLFTALSIEAGYDTVQVLIAASNVDKLHSLLERCYCNRSTRITKYFNAL